MYDILQLTQPVPRQGRIAYLAWMVGAVMERRRKILARLLTVGAAVGLTCLYVWI